MYLVLELVEGGELFDFVVDRGCNGLPEDSAREIFRQIVDAVAYLHAKNISHRDLKPENILLAKKPVDEHGPFEVKLSDFGLSRLVGATSFMQTMCGTPSYLAPEVLGGEGSDKGYDVKVGKKKQKKVVWTTTFSKFFWQG
jgi:serine/threonine protein kinase